MSDDVKQVPVEKNRGGQWITFGDEQYRVPPLAFRAIQDLAQEVASLKDIVGTPSAEQMQAVEKIVHAAIARNYPSLSIDQVSDMLDIGNYQQVLSAVLSIGGFTKAAAPGGAGETLTGAASTSP